MNYKKYILILITLCIKPVHATEIIHHNTIETQELITRSLVHRLQSNSSRTTPTHAPQKTYRRNWGNNWQNITQEENDPITSKTIIKNQQAPENSDSLRRPLPLSFGHNFTAATIADAIDPLITPPNPNGAVGTEQYILMTYNVIRSFNKSTGEADNVLNLDAASFFGCLANDVRISYDRFSHRWFMSCEETNQTTGRTSNIKLAMSSGPVISNCSTWTFFTFSNETMIPQLDRPGTGILDYQQLAIDAHNVYISADTFNKKGIFKGTSTLVIKKSSLISGSVVSTVFPGILPGSKPNRVSGITPPADNFDPNPNYGYIVNATNNTYPSGNTYNKIYLYRILNPWSSTPALGSMVTIPVPSYSDSANAPHAGNLFGSNALLQTGGCFFAAPHVRNHQLYVCHNIQVNQSGVGTPNGNRVGIRWYQFDLTGDVTGHGHGVESEATVPALIQYGTLYDSTSTVNPHFFFIPSIMTNEAKTLIIGCTTSGKAIYPNAVVAMRNFYSTKGTLSEALSLTCYCNPYNFGPFVNPSNGNIGQRWGDLSSMSIDPVNDLDIWSTQQFAALQNGWGIQVTQLQSFYVC